MVWPFDEPAAGSAGPVASSLPDFGALSGTGFGAHDAVRAEIGGGGRLHRLVIDPDLLRSGAEAVADAVIQAVNAAQADVAQQATALLGGAGSNSSDAAAAAQAGRQQLDSIVADLESLTARLSNP